MESHLEKKVVEKISPLLSSSIPKTKRNLLVEYCEKVFFFIEEAAIRSNLLLKNYMEEEKKKDTSSLNTSPFFALMSHLPDGNNETTTLVTYIKYVLLLDQILHKTWSDIIPLEKFFNLLKGSFYVRNDYAVSEKYPIFEKAYSELIHALIKKGLDEDKIQQLNKTLDAKEGYFTQALDKVKFAVKRSLLAKEEESTSKRDTRLIEELCIAETDPDKFIYFTLEVLGNSLRNIDFTIWHRMIFSAESDKKALQYLEFLTKLFNAISDSPRGENYKYKLAIELGALLLSKTADPYNKNQKPCAISDMLKTKKYEEAKTCYSKLLSSIFQRWYKMFFLVESDDIACQCFNILISRFNEASYFSLNKKYGLARELQVFLFTEIADFSQGRHESTTVDKMLRKKLEEKGHQKAITCYFELLSSIFSIWHIMVYSECPFELLSSISKIWDKMIFSAESDARALSYLEFFTELLNVNSRNALVNQYKLAEQLEALILPKTVELDKDQKPCSLEKMLEEKKYENARSCYFNLLSSIKKKQSPLKTPLSRLFNSPVRLSPVGSSDPTTALLPYSPSSSYSSTDYRPKRR